MYLSRRRSAQRTPLIRLGGAGFGRGQQQKPPKSKPSPVDKTEKVEGVHDAQTGVPLGIPRGARCVQRFDDSLNSAIHITYRISLRSSSMREPRDPLLKVVLIACDRKKEDVLHMHSKGVYVKTQVPLGTSQKGTHAAMHKGVRWI